MSHNTVDLDAYAAADSDLLDLILEESDKRVAAQVQLMLAADARASGILSGCVALAAGGVGFAASQMSVGGSLFWAALAFGVVEALAACLALWALFPEPVNPQGWAPATFATDLKKPTNRVKAEVAKFLQVRIESNRTLAAKLSFRVKAAMLTATLAPIWGLAAALASDGQYVWAWPTAMVSLVVVGLLAASVLPKKG